MINRIIINQPAGLGDIFFCQKIAHILYENYRVPILWPVIPNFEWINKYIKTDFIEFMSTEKCAEYKKYVIDDIVEPYEIDSNLIIPLLRSSRAVSASIMEAKYKFIGLDFSDWLDYFTFERDMDRENDLYENVLGLKDSDDYIFINKNFASPPDIQTIKNIQPITNKKIVEMKFLSTDNLFDWCKVIQNASEIYTVETSICYLIEKLNCKCQYINLYSRNREPNFDYIKNIFRKNYNYHEGRCN